MSVASTASTTASPTVRTRRSTLRETSVASVDRRVFMTADPTAMVATAKPTRAMAATASPTVATVPTAAATVLNPTVATASRNPTAAMVSSSRAMVATVSSRLTASRLAMVSSPTAAKTEATAMLSTEQTYKRIRK